MLHHGNRLIRIEPGRLLVVCQSVQALLGLFIFSTPNEPPRTFRSEENESTEEGRPHQLQVVRQLPGEVVSAAELGLDNSDTDDLTETPAEVDVGGEVLTECHGHDFRGVGDSH